MLFERLYIIDRGQGQSTTVSRRPFTLTADGNGVNYYLNRE